MQAHLKKIKDAVRIQIRLLYFWKNYIKFCIKYLFNFLGSRKVKVTSISEEREEEDGEDEEGEDKDNENGVKNKDLKNEKQGENKNLNEMKIWEKDIKEPFNVNRGHFSLYTRVFHKNTFSRKSKDQPSKH